MYNFSAAVHTSERFVTQLETLFQFDDIYVVGSLGRSAIYNVLLDDPFHEFRLRNEHVLQRADGTARDIDVVVAGAYTPCTEPFRTDTTSRLNGGDMKIIKDGADWFLTSLERKFAEALDPAVVEPVLSRTVYGAPVRTFPAQTLLALYEHEPRTKDVLTAQLLAKVVSTTDAAPLPEKLYAPFNRLAEVTNQSYGYHVRKAWKLLPPSLRSKIYPVTRYVSRHL